jgi:imidazolonepropionase
MILYKNISQLIGLSGAHQKDGRNLAPEDLGLIEDAAIIFDNDQIHWVGATSDIPNETKFQEEYDLTGKTLTPEIVDSHTHLVFAGNRSDEYVMRLNGADYQAIANAGGGILSTTRETRAASEEKLFELAAPRIERLYSYGVGTIEIKTGYCLNFEQEYLCSLVIDRLKKHFSPKIQIINTSMAAHALPSEHSNSKDYIQEVVLRLLNKLHEDDLVDQVDIFHEKKYFDAADVRQVFEHCQKLGLSFKLHADEFHDNGGAELAAEYGALSADHLLSCGSKGRIALARSSSVATFLPGTGFFLGKPQANAKAFLEEGAKVCLASDYNPGSCHVDNLLLIASLIAPHENYKLNIAQLWSAITLNAAHALGLKDQGAILKGQKPRFSLFDVPKASEITYSWGRNFACPLPHLK